MPRFVFVKKIFFFFLGFFKVIVREPTSISELKLWAVKSTALACENLMLAFRAYGYDTCPMVGYDSHRVKKALGLSWNQTLVMIVSAGKRKEEGVYGPRIRFEREKFIKEI